MNHYDFSTIHRSKQGHSSFSVTFEIVIKTEPDGISPRIANQINSCPTCISETIELSIILQQLGHKYPLILLLMCSGVLAVNLSQKYYV